jgi:hypothetical protein
MRPAAACEVGPHPHVGEVQGQPLSRSLLPDPLSPAQSRRDRALVRLRPGAVESRDRW